MSCFPPAIVFVQVRNWPWFLRLTSTSPLGRRVDAQVARPAKCPRFREKATTVLVLKLIETRGNIPSMLLWNKTERFRYRN